MWRLWNNIVTLCFLACLLLTPALALTVKENYLFYCAPCHGIEGRGDGPNATPTQPVAPRNHRSKKEMSKLSDQDIINVIKFGGRATGISTLMPPYKNTLTEEEIVELKDYLRELCQCRGPE